MGDWVPLNYLYPLVHRHWTEPEFTFAIENLGFVEFGQNAVARLCPLQQVFQPNLSAGVALFLRSLELLPWLVEHHIGDEVRP